MERAVPQIPENRPDAKTDDSSSTETTDSGEASADSSDGSFDGVKIEVDIEDSIQGDQNTLDCFNKLIDEFSQQTGAEVEVSSKRK